MRVDTIVYDGGVAVFVGWVDLFNGHRGRSEGRGRQCRCTIADRSVRVGQLIGPRGGPYKLFSARRTTWPGGGMPVGGVAGRLRRGRGMRLLRVARYNAGVRWIGRNILNGLTGLSL